MGLHASGEHIVVNLFLLFFVGFSMELIHGTLRPLLVYFLGVVTSSMFFFVFDCGTLVGCSGGVFSLVAASLSSIILNWKEDKAVLVKIHPKKAPFAFAGKMLRNLKLICWSIFCVGFGLALGVNIFASRKGVGFWSWWEQAQGEENETDFAVC